MPKPGADPAAGGDGTRAAFDRWLDDGLHSIYDKVAEEPVPVELLRLIEQARARSDGNKK